MTDVTDAASYTVLHAAREGQRSLTAEVLWSIPRVGSPVPAPDGRSLVVPVTTYELDEDHGTTRLWSIDTTTEDARPLTAADKSCSQPAFSPDGSKLAFVAKSKAKDAVPQIFVMPTDGGEAECVTDMPVGCFDPKWLPDGTGLVFGAWFYEGHLTAEASRLEHERRKDRPVTVHATEDRFYRFWDQWLTNGKIPHLFQLFLGGEPEDLMPDSTLWMGWMEAAGHYDIHPDGTEIVFAGFHVGGAENRLRGDIYRMPINEDGSEPECLTAGNPAGSWRPRYTPCGGAILYGKQVDPDFYADRPRLMRIENGKHDAWLEDWDRAPAAWTFGDGGNIWFAAEDDGAQHVYTLNLSDARTEGAMPTRVASGGTCSSPRPAADGNVYYNRHAVSEPPEVWRVPAGGGEPERMTHFSDGALADVAMGEVRDYRFEGAEGASVQAVVILPPGHEEGSPLPLVHSIHGGPHGAFSDLFHFRWNTHAFAAPGYAVACVNFQGSTSWGNDFARRIRGAWGDRPYRDVIAATDMLIETGVADAERMAISGGSYGGYLTAWIASKTDRFRCAVNHAGVYDLVLQYASDVTWGRAKNLGGDIWAEPDLVDEYNPARHSKGLNTPMLVIHGEKDYRVPINHALECYGILQARGVESRLLYFADENHWILKPRNSLRWYEEVLGWFERFIGSVGP